MSCLSHVWPYVWIAGLSSDSRVVLIHPYHQALQCFVNVTIAFLTTEAIYHSQLLLFSSEVIGFPQLAAECFWPVYDSDAVLGQHVACSCKNYLDVWHCIPILRWIVVVIVVVIVIVVVEASAPRAYWRVALTSVSIGGKDLEGRKELPKMLCLVASSLGHLRS